MKQLTFGPVMIDIAGLSLTALDKEKIAHPNTGGLILFARNYENPEQVRELAGQIRACRNGDLLLAVDQEGGRVQRFQNGFTPLPAAQAYGDDIQIAEDGGWLMAGEVLSVGMDISFAPVLDVDCGLSQIIGDRAFSQDPRQAAKIASAFRKGMNAAGMAATGKHFPGHGSTALDSHTDLPVDDRELEQIRLHDLVPFQLLIGEGLEAIMPAHVLYPRVDRYPAGFSEIWLQQVLRQELGFDGVIFSDDLSMQGAAQFGDFPETAGLALQSGCDMVLVCNNPPAAEQVLDSIKIQNQPNRQRRLQTMLAKNQINRQQLLSSGHWQDISQKIRQLCESYA